MPSFIVFTMTLLLAVPVGATVVQITGGSANLQSANFNTAFLSGPGVEIAGHGLILCSHIA